MYGIKVRTDNRDLKSTLTIKDAVGMPNREGPKLAKAHLAQDLNAGSKKLPCWGMSLGLVADIINNSEEEANTNLLDPRTGLKFISIHESPMGKQSSNCLLLT